MEPVEVAAKCGPLIGGLGGAFMRDEATTARGAALGLDVADGMQHAWHLAATLQLTRACTRPCSSWNRAVAASGNTASCHTPGSTYSPRPAPTRTVTGVPAGAQRA